MKASQANANLLAALPAVLKALNDYRAHGYSSEGFCHEINSGHLSGTPEVIGALLALQRWVEENAAEDNAIEQAEEYEASVCAYYASIGAANRY